MKTKRLTYFVATVLAAFAGPALAVDFVDIGNPTSEFGHAMSGWGPIEPLSSGGTYGGVADCRAIWDISDNNPSAAINLNFAGGPEGLYFRHLEGLADDGFEVYVDNALLYTHIENTTSEQWFVSSVMVNVTAGVHTVAFMATGVAWSGFATYGQVCFDRVWVGTEDPVDVEPGAWGEVKALFR